MTAPCYTLTLTCPFELPPGTSSPDQSELMQDRAMELTMAIVALLTSCGHRIKTEAHCTFAGGTVAASIPIELADDLVAMDLQERFQKVTCEHMTVSVLPDENLP